MPHDPDIHTEMKTQQEIADYISAFSYKRNLNLGPHLMHNTQYFIDLIPLFLSEENKRVPCQVNSGPLLNCRHYMALPPELVELHKKGQVEIFFHLPFPFQFYHETPDYMVDYIKGHLELIRGRYGIEPKYVVHANYYGMRDLVEVLPKAVDTFKRVFEPCRDLVLMENLVGSDKYEVSPVSPTFINENFLKPLMPDERLGICLDTEHHFASKDVWEDIPRDMVKLIHLNSHPANVFEGSRIDLHSYTYLRNSVSPEFILWLRQEFPEVPAVLERRLGSIMADDIVYVNQVLDGTFIKE